MCEKHGVEKVLRKNIKGNDINMCTQCMSEYRKLYYQKIKNNPELYAQRKKRQNELAKISRKEIKNNPELYAKTKEKLKERYNNYVNKIISNADLHNKRKEYLRKNANKYRNSDNYKNKIINKNVGKFSDLYCNQCNINRTYGKNIYNNRIYTENLCNDCIKFNDFKLNHDYISICKHCKKEYGLDIKYAIRNKVALFNFYCSEQCNKDNIILKKKETKRKYRKTDFYKNSRNDRASHKKRCEALGLKYEKIDRTKVFVKYNYICQGCNIKCVHPNNNTYLQSNCATLDHIIPIKKYGSHSYDNVTLLCRDCNSKKGTKINYFKNKQKHVQMSLDLSFDVLHSIGNKAQQMTLFEPM